MRKSITVFFLMGSLIMLAAIPVNIFSNAMAQGYNDNNYFGDNSYSKYPTDEKKYECRTGPFEGFFVSSVEFCKHVKFDKDDSKRDSNRTGINGTNLYTVIGNTILAGGEVIVPTLTTSSFIESSVAICDAGDLVSGGAFVISGPSTINTIISSKPLATENGWNATAELKKGGSVTADAICLDNPPLRP